MWMNTTYYKQLKSLAKQSQFFLVGMNVKMLMINEDQNQVLKHFKLCLGSDKAFIYKTGFGWA